MFNKKCDEMVYELFDNLDRWRHLPTYQLERRAEIFFSFYFDDILGLNGKDLQLIPEFPLPLSIVAKGEPRKKGSREYKQQTCKVDYLVVTHEKIFFIEIKTDDTYVVGKTVKNLVEEKDEFIGQQLHRMLVARKHGMIIGVSGSAYSNASGTCPASCGRIVLNLSNKPSAGLKHLQTASLG